MTTANADSRNMQSASGDGSEKLRDSDSCIGQMTRNWGWTALRGVLAVGFGLVALAMPLAAVYAMTVVFGAFAFTDGVFSLVAALRRQASDRPLWALVLSGILGVFAGIVVLIMPHASMVALVLFNWVLIGVWSVITGVFEVVAGVRLRRDSKGGIWLILSGAIRTVAGIAVPIILVLNPLASIPAMGLLLGIYALASGVALLVLAFVLRRDADRPARDVG